MGNQVLVMKPSSHDHRNTTTGACTCLIFGSFEGTTGTCMISKVTFAVWAWMKVAWSTIGLNGTTKKFLVASTGALIASW